MKVTTQAELNAAQGRKQTCRHGPHNEYRAARPATSSMYFWPLPVFKSSTFSSRCNQPVASKLDTYSRAHLQESQARIAKVLDARFQLPLPSSVPTFSISRGSTADE